jgi:hypothetical protein
MKTKLFISALAFMALTTLAAAQSKEVSSPAPQSGTGKGMNFVDTDKNGICDNYENNAPIVSNCRRSEANNCCCLGRRQMHGYGNGSGRSQGMRKGMRQDKGHGKNFVDMNKNGICDNFEAASKK